MRSSALNKTPKNRLDTMAANGKNAGRFLINDVSRQVGLSQKRLREYEKEGLIKPEREPKTNNRRYTETDIHQIQRIKTLIHMHGFTLACLKYILRNASCWTIFDCNEKETCPSYGNPHTPCYEVVRAAGCETESKACPRCPIYLNRNEKLTGLLSKP
jgi:MerR family transcriptional regulator, repressor of the yfmOP operon